MNLRKDNKYLTSVIMDAENHLFQNCLYIIIFNNFTMENISCLSTIRDLTGKEINQILPLLTHLYRINPLKM